MRSLFFGWQCNRTLLNCESKHGPASLLPWRQGHALQTLVVPRGGLLSIRKNQRGA